MYFKDLKDSPFFGDQCLTYTTDGKIRFYARYEFQIEFGSGHFIDYIEHVDGEPDMTIYYNDGKSMRVSMQEELHMGIYKLVHVLNT